MLDECYNLLVKKLMLISSGGGHLQELMQLKPLMDKYDVSVISEKTETTIFIDEFKKHDYLVYGTKDHLLPYLFIFPFNILKSLVLYLKYKPDVIITTGTHTAIPMCYIGHIFKSKIIWIETLANANTPTKAGKLVYKFADLFLVQWESMLDIYPNAKYWGNLF